MATSDRGPSTDASNTRRSSRRVAIDLIVAITLIVALSAVYVLEPRESRPPDLTTGGSDLPPPPPPPPPPPVLLQPVDPTPRVEVRCRPDGRFGLVSLSGNPDDPSDDHKKLTYAEDGATNNTRVKVDGRSPLFGSPEGATVQPIHIEPDGAWVMIWEFQGVRVRQAFQLVAGDVSRRTDSLRVTYTLENTGAGPHEVGLRVMLDTLIGGNDGVPFLVPGREGVVTRPLTMEGSEVPDYVQSLEGNSLERPGVVVDIGLVPSAGAERPSTLTLTHWPGAEAAWDYDRALMFDTDTAAGLYYAVKPLAPGASRSMGFSYGLGTISSTRSRNASLSLTTSGPIRSGGSFWLMVLVKNPKAGQSVTLSLPPGLKPQKPATLTQSPQSGGQYTQLSWLLDVDPGALGQIEVTAALQPGDVKERQTLNVEPPDVQLTLRCHGRFRAGGSSWVLALVRRPRTGQAITLTLPDGISFAPGQTPTQSIAADASKSAARFAQLNWLVTPAARAEGRYTLTARLAPDGGEARAEIDVSPPDLTH